MNNAHKTFILVIVLIAAVGLSINPTSAEILGDIPVCHCEPLKGCVTIYVSEEGAREHLDKHEDDYLGVCKPT